MATITQQSASQTQGGYQSSDGPRTTGYSKRRNRNQEDEDWDSQGGEGSRNEPYQSGSGSNHKRDQRRHRDSRRVAKERGKHWPSGHARESDERSSKDQSRDQSVATQERTESSYVVLEER